MPWKQCIVDSIGLLGTRVTFCQKLVLVRIVVLILEVVAANLGY